MDEIEKLLVTLLGRGVADNLMASAIIAVIAFLLSPISKRFRVFLSRSFVAQSFKELMRIAKYVYVSHFGTPETGQVVVPGEFIGRDDEIKRFHEFLRSDTKNVLSIHGKTGRGKTWLISKLAHECQKRRLPFSIVDFQNASSEPFSVMNKLQSQLGPRRFAYYLSEHEEYHKLFKEHCIKDIKPQAQVEKKMATDLQEQETKVTKAFLQCLSALSKSKPNSVQPVVLFFDTFEKIENSEFPGWLKDNLLPLLRPSNKLKVVLAGWNPLDWGREWSSFIENHELKVFSEGDFKRYAETVLKVAASDKEFITLLEELSRRHPLYLGVAATLFEQLREKGKTVTSELLISMEEEIGGRDMSERLKRLLDRLEIIDPAMMRWIRCCAVTRQFNATSVRVIIGVSEEESLDLVDEILTKYPTFIRRYPSGYGLHEHIRQVIVQEWLIRDSKGFIDLNEKALSYFKSLSLLSSPLRNDEKHRAELEMLYHQFLVDEEQGLELYIVLRHEYLEKLRRGDLAAALQTLVSDLAFPQEVGEPLIRDALTRRWILYGEARLKWFIGEVETAHEIYQCLLDQPYLSSSLLALELDC